MIMKKEADMYFDKTKIGTNIKNLRKAYGETQKKLGCVIGVADTTISMYESGINLPDMETLQMIAEHFRIPVEILISGDFSDVDFKNMDMSWEKILELSLVTYPIVCNDEAMKDEHFSKAYKETNILMQRIYQQDESILGRTVLNILKEYVVSYKTSKNLEAVANIIALMMFNHVNDIDEYVNAEKITDAIFYQKSTKKDFAKEYLLRNEFSSGVIEDEQQEERRKTFYEKIIKWIKILKGSPQYTDLADYYLALLFVRNIVDNDNGAILNQKIGNDMMMLLVDLDNEYALSYFAKIIEIVEPE